MQLDRLVTHIYNSIHNKKTLAKRALVFMKTVKMDLWNVCFHIFGEKKTQFFWRNETWWICIMGSNCFTGNCEVYRFVKSVLTHFWFYTQSKDTLARRYNEILYICKICYTKFTILYTMKRHWREEHWIPKRWWCLVDLLKNDQFTKCTGWRDTGVKHTRILELFEVC